MSRCYNKSHRPTADSLTDGIPTANISAQGMRYTGGPVIRERVSKIVMMIVGSIFVAGIYPIAMYLWRPGNGSPGDAMIQFVRHARFFLAVGSAKSIGVSQPDRLRGLGKHRSCHGDGAHGNPSCERPQRFAHGHGRGWSDRCGPSRVGSSKTTMTGSTPMHPSSCVLLST